MPEGITPTVLDPEEQKDFFSDGESSLPPVVKEIPKKSPIKRTELEEILGDDNNEGLLGKPEVHNN